MLYGFPKIFQGVVAQNYRTFNLAGLHRAEEIRNWMWMSLKYSMNSKQKYKDNMQVMDVTVRSDFLGLCDKTFVTCPILSGYGVVTAWTAE